MLWYNLKILLEEKVGFFEDIENKIKEYKYSRVDNIEAHTKNTYIFYTGVILSKSE